MRTSHLSLLEKCKPHLGSSASQDQTLVLAGFKTERESENIRNLSERKQLFIKSKAKSVAFASAVNTEEPSGIRKELQWFPDKTAHPTFSPSLEPSV